MPRRRTAAVPPATSAAVHNLGTCKVGGTTEERGARTKRESAGRSEVRAGWLGAASNDLGKAPTTRGPAPPAPSMFPFGNSRFVPAMAGTNLPF